MPPKKARPQKKACDICYRRKIQCSLPNPGGPCEWCSHRSLECTFNRERPSKRQRNSVKPSDIQNLFRRIDQLEEALLRAETAQERDVSTPEEPTILVSSKVNPPQISIRPSIRESAAFSESFPSPASCAQASASSNDYPISDWPHEGTMSANQLGPNWYFNGIPISSSGGREWISTRTDQAAMWVEFSIPINATSPLSALQPSSIHEICELPDKDSTRQVLNAFFRSSFGLTFPVLDEVLFESTIEMAYGPMNKMMPSPSQLAARACVFSTLSISSHLNMSRQIPLSIDADLYADKAHYLLMHITGHVSLATLQATVILQLRYAFRAHWQGAALLHSIACHIVFSLRGHLYQLPKPVGVETSSFKRERHHVRLLFWICYMLDKDISLRIGNPPILTDENCDLTPPDNYLDCYTYLPGLDQFLEDNESTNGHLTSHFPGDIRFSRLKEKVYRLLFSARALNNTDNQLILNIRQLDDETEHWRLSIPASFRPALFVSQNSSSIVRDEGIPHIIRRMSLQLEYHHLMTVIHTTVRKCTAEASDGTRDLHDVVHSSFDISLMASRSTFWCLRFLIDTIAEQAFRFITFYSIPAAMSLFLNIVIHPLDSQVQLDLELLISAVNSIRSISGDSMMPSEIDLLQHLSNFVMRLVWLGSCAVMKAKRDNRDESSQR